MERPVLIKEASEIVGVHPNTKRSLESRGIFKARRNYNGYRIYSLSELLLLKRKLESPPESEED